MAGYVINLSSNKDLKLYTIYSPPQHKNGVVHKTKEDAMADGTDHLQLKLDFKIINSSINL